MSVGTCGGCDSRWTGLKMAHCASCHHTFSTPANFDAHRRDGECLPPESVNLVQNDRGTWKGKDERDISEIHRSRRTTSA